MSQISSIPRSDSELEGGGRFEIRERLGEGGMGIVYRAFDRQRGIEVALKRLHFMNADGIAQLKQEFRAIADVTHPNLVPLYELVSTGGAWFFTMELVRGVTFAEYVRDDPERRDETHESPADAGDLSPPNALSPPLAFASTPIQPRPPEPSPSPASEPADAGSSHVPSTITLPDLSGIPSGFDVPAIQPEIKLPCRAHLPRLSAALRQLVEAVSALHEAGKLHLDLKPSNVLVRADGRVVVLDFGLARDAAPEPIDAPESEPKPAAGTPAYMAPEQARGDRPDAAADWYAVGVMLYEALTGTQPFGGDLRTLLTMKQYADPTPPSELVTGVPAELEALCLRLLSRDTQHRATGADIVRFLGGAPGELRAALSSPSTGAASFVGREPELHALREAFEEARRGRPVAVIIDGPSGMGKTALVKHFLSELRARSGALVVSGRCHERELMPFKAMDRIIDALSAHLERLPAAESRAILPRNVHALARLFPAFERHAAASAGAAPSVESPDPHELRALGFQALKELLSNLARRASLVFSIDDLQWGDSDSARLLLELFTPPEPPAILLIGTCRSEEEGVSPFLRELFASDPEGTPGAVTRRVRIEALPRDQATQLARALLKPHGDQALAYAEAIARESLGTPFFVGELVRHSVEHRLGDPSAAPRAPLAGVNLVELLEARLDRLPAEARRALEVIAVAARPVEQGVALRAAGVHDGAAAAVALGVLRAGRWIRSRGAGPEDAVETYHDRIRGAAADIEAARLGEVHLRLAEELEATGRAGAESLAVHFGEAGQFDKAGAYAERAAAQAEQVLAFDSAAKLYKLALQWRPGEAAHARGLLRRMGDAWANAGRGADAAEAYLRAAEGAPPAEAMELQLRAAERLLISGHFNEGVERLRPLLDAAGLPYPETNRAVFTSLLFRRAKLALRGFTFTRRDAASVDPELLRRIDAFHFALRGLSSFEPMRSAVFAAEHMLLALSAGEPSRIVRGLVFEASVHVMNGAPGAARVRELLDLAARVRGDMDSPYLDVHLLLVRGYSECASGRFRESLASMSEAEKILLERCTDTAWERLVARSVMVASMAALGDVAALSARLPGWLKDAEDRSDSNASTMLYLMGSAGVEVALAADDPSRARRELRAALARLPQRQVLMQHYYALQSEVFVDLYTGDGASAWRRVTAELPTLNRSLILRTKLMKAQALMIRSMAAVGFARELTGRRRADLARAAERYTEAIVAEIPWTKGIPLLNRATAASLRGEQDRARALLTEAVSEFKANEQGSLAAAAERRLGELVGGDEGRALIAKSDAFMTRQAIRDPARMTAMLTPGF